jgi:histone-lysine N-methyltransferase SETMAR
MCTVLLPPGDNPIAVDKYIKYHRLDFSVMPHPPYSPDLAPSDFHLFPKRKERLKGQCFSCDEEVKCAVRKWFQKQNTNFLKDGLQELVQRWRKSIEVRGDFVGK